MAGQSWLWARLGCYVVVPFVLVTSMLAYFQRTLIYVPDQSPVRLGESGFESDRVREVSRVTDDGLTLKGWLIAAEGTALTAEANGFGEQRPLVLYFPGNGGHRGYRLKEIRQLTSLGCDVLYFDYRGYGGNPGWPTEADLARDARGVWNFAVEQLGAQPERTILWGESLGGGVATGVAWDLCREGTQAGGLILRCTFTSLPDAGAYHYPWLPVRWVLLDRYPSIDRIGNVTCPLLVIHGREDTIVPFEQGQRLFNAAPAQSSGGVAKRFLDLPQAGHNDMMYVAADEIRDAVGEFLTSAGQVERSARQLHGASTDSRNKESRSAK
ncbi:MAG: alpha/beta hydrolase [Planctomycetaceae bacterium]